MSLLFNMPSRLVITFLPRSKHLLISWLQSLSPIRVVSSAYLRLLIFLPAIVIPACVSTSPAFLTMYSAYKLNKQGDNITALTYSFSYLEPVGCSMSSSNCCFLTAYRFLKRQIRWSDIPISFRIFHSLL